MAINTGALSKALRPGVNTWFGLAYDQFPEEWSQIFDMEMSDMNYEEDVNAYGFGLAPVKAEGQALSYDTMQQAIYVRYIHIVYALGYIITREAIEDNLYMKLAKQQTDALAFSMRQTKEIVCANVLNRAFNSSYVGADGLSLCNSSHLLTKGGTYNNQPVTAADLSEAALEQALIDIGGILNDAGLRISAMGMKLIIPRQLQFEATRILQSSLRNDTAENAVNAMLKIGVLPGGICLNHYLTSASAWFIKTNVPKGLRLFQRRPLGLDNDTEFDTENMKFKASERYSVGFTDWRGIYGSNGP
jgi:hypothetical protein